MPQKGSRFAGATASAVVLGVVCGLVVAGGAGEAAPPSPTIGQFPHATSNLELMEDQLEKAQQLEPGSKKASETLKEAAEAKRKFLDFAFDHDVVAGCKRADTVITELDEIDASVERAAAGYERPDAGLKAAKGWLSDWVDSDCEGMDVPQQLAFQSISKLVKRLAKDGDAPSGAERKRLKSLKVELLTGSRVQGCDATDLFELTDEIDTAIDIVTYGEFKKGRETQAAQKLISDAVRKGRKLIKFYKQVPCEEGLTTTTTTDSTSTSTATSTDTTTTTSTPASPACSDGADNDSDGKVDGADPGCLSTQDTTEQTNDWPFHYPGDGFSGFDWIDLKPFFGPFAGTVMSYRVFFGMSTVHTSTSLNHGATPISGTMPCPFLGPTGIRAGVGGMAPTGGGLPAAPDSDHLRIVIDTSDPPGGGDCGLGPVNLEVATDTRLP